MTSETVVKYYWKLTLKGHLRAVYVQATDSEEAKAKGNRVGHVTAVERLMPVSKRRAKGYSFPTTFWQEAGKVKDV